jgi:hypothetical protein
LDYHYEPLNAAELSEITDAWLDKYHFYRTHEAPGFLTPRHQDGAPSKMTRYLDGGSVFRHCWSIHSNFGGSVLFIVSTDTILFFSPKDDKVADKLQPVQ